METFLVTGGTGSFGQAFVREILEHNPASVRIFSRNEYYQWQMRQDFNDDRLRFLIGDVRDRERLRRAMEDVDVVIHAAALKHVPTCEYNPIEAIKTNIDGSINVIDAAIDGGVSKVLAISSDKAVHPLNLYGATKLVEEKLFIYGNVYGDTMFSCVRFGNFEPSRGSVFELWAAQEKRKEILTVTDTQMTRFYIGVNEAAKFTIKCIEIMEGGEIFIPKMELKSNFDLLEKIAPGVPIKIIGRRKGEKRHEAIFAEGEQYKEFDDFYIITELDEQTYTMPLQNVV